MRTARDRSLVVQRCRVARRTRNSCPVALPNACAIGPYAGPVAESAGKRLPLQPSIKAPEENTPQKRGCSNVAHPTELWEMKICLTQKVTPEPGPFARRNTHARTRTRDGNAIVILLCESPHPHAKTELTMCYIRQSGQFCSVFHKLTSVVWTTEIAGSGAEVAQSAALGSALQRRIMTCSSGTRAGAGSRSRVSLSLCSVSRRSTAGAVFPEEKTDP